MESLENRLRTDDALAEVRQTLRSKDVVDVDEELVKIVVFRCGGGLYAFLGRDVREIIPDREIHPVPTLPEYLPGLINVRGDIESAVDIRFFLGGEKDKRADGMIIMAVRDSFRTGVIIDSVEDVVDMPAGSIKPPLPTLTGAARELAAGEVEWQGRTAVLLDVEKLMAKVTL